MARLNQSAWGAESFAENAKVCGPNDGIARRPDGDRRRRANSHTDFCGVQCRVMERKHGKEKAAAQSRPRAAVVLARWLACCGGGRIGWIDCMVGTRSQAKRDGLADQPAEVRPLRSGVRNELRWSNPPEVRSRLRDAVTGLLHRLPSPSRTTNTGAENQNCPTNAIKRRCRGSYYEYPSTNHLHRLREVRRRLQTVSATARSFANPP